MSYILNQKHDINFQQYSAELSQALKNVLQNPGPRLLICLPRYLTSLIGCTSHCKKYWWAWGRDDNKQEKIVKLLRRLTGRNYLFGDALISRPYMDRQNNRYAAKIFDEIKGLWKNRDVLIIEGDQTRLGVKNDLFDECRSVKRILAPSTGAFDMYEEIKKTTVQLYDGELIILALGPTATILAADLADDGIQALDIGHLDIEYEWFLMHATKKEAIDGKYTNECAGGQTCTECNDAQYLSQIVARIPAASCSSQNVSR